MLSLIKKDCLLLRKYMPLILFILIVLPASIAMQSDGGMTNASALTFAFEVIYAEILISRYLAIKECQYPKAVSFLCVLPYTRSMLIISKYILYFIVFILCCAAYGIDTLIFPNLAGFGFELILPVFFISSVLYSIYMPVLYQFGYEKTKLIFMLVLIAVPLMLSKLDVTAMAETISNITYPVMLVVSVAALFLSLMATIKIENEKEL